MGDKKTPASNPITLAGINTAFPNPYFSVENGGTTILGFGTGSFPVVKPINGNINVLRDMRWSNKGDVSEVPYLIAKEYELNFGTWATNFLQVADFIEKAVKNNSIDVFLSLYSGSPTNFSYTLPYLLNNNDSIRHIENSWTKASGIGDLVSSVAGKNITSGKTDGSAVSELLAAGLGAVVGSITPGFGFEETYQFGSTQNQSITVSFPLYNTASVKEAINHFSFVQLITMQNLKTRTSLMTYIPPKIYTIDSFSLGGTYMAAAYIKSLKVDSIGTTRILNLNNSTSKMLIPEAYKITITFEDLLSQSSNVFAGTIGGTKVSVISDLSKLGAPYAENINKYLNGLIKNAEPSIIKIKNDFSDLTKPQPAAQPAQPQTTP